MCTGLHAVTAHHLLCLLNSGLALRNRCKTVQIATEAQRIRLWKHESVTNLPEMRTGEEKRCRHKISSSHI